MGGTFDMLEEKQPSRAQEAETLSADNFLESAKKTQTVLTAISDLYNFDPSTQKEEFLSACDTISEIIRVEEEKLLKIEFTKVKRIILKQGAKRLSFGPKGLVDVDFSLEENDQVSIKGATFFRDDRYSLMAVKVNRIDGFSNHSVESYIPVDDIEKIEF